MQHENLPKPTHVPESTEIAEDILSLREEVKKLGESVSSEEARESLAAAQAQLERSKEQIAVLDTEFKDLAAKYKETNDPGVRETINAEISSLRDKLNMETDKKLMSEEVIKSFADREELFESWREEVTDADDELKKILH